MTRLIKLSMIFLFITTVAVMAQKKDYSSYDGYLDFKNIESLMNTDESTEIIIEEKLLRMVGRLAKHEDPELQDLLENIKLVKAVTFDVYDKNYKELHKIVSDMAVDLDKKGWDRIVKSKSRDNIAFVYIKTEGEEGINGLAVMSVEESGQAAFVNVVGTIDLDAIGRLGAKFDIPALYKVNGHNSDRKKIEKE